MKKIILFFESKVVDYLNRIEKYSGYGWTVDKIPVYLAPGSARFKSYAIPNLEDKVPGIVLKTYRTMETAEFVFIHELCHINQMQSEFWSVKNPWYMWDSIKNIEGIELCADMVMLYVIRDMYGVDSIQEKEMWEFYKVSPENVAKASKMKEMFEVWKLDEKPLKSYL